jgi:type II secretory pathway pseudopilin PulG
MNTQLTGSISPRPEAPPAGGFNFELSVPPRSLRAFTMIEIAISLAIIGFALVAIIGILPTGLNAQRDNRQETIVNQDASVLIDAVRNGERGLDDLTNYVVGITNYTRDYSRAAVPGPAAVWAYTVNGSTLNGNPSNPQYPLTNGYSIVGLLSTPKILIHPSGVGYLSNHIVAVFRSLSGPASEKPPQANPIMQDLGLQYKVIAEVNSYGTNFFDASWTNYSLGGLSTNEIASRSNYMNLVQTFQTNTHDLRLTFLWPLLPNGKVGSGRQVYRTMAVGHYTNDPPGSPYFFMQPRTFF